MLKIYLLFRLKHTYFASRNGHTEPATRWKGELMARVRFSFHFFISVTITSARMKIIALEYSYVDWSGKQRIINYVPVDSIETGLYLAKEALACETSRGNITIEHPSEYVWIITSHNALLGDQAYMIAVTERDALTMADVRSVVNSSSDPSNP